MNKKDLIKKIVENADLDRERRKDPRYKRTMGFLVAKGFLAYNKKIPILPNQKIHIEDAIWAGTQVEPRILEVLPAAILRLPRHFIYGPRGHRVLEDVIRALKEGDDQGPDFYGVTYSKIRFWVELPLRDKRIKPYHQKKVTKTFRLSPEVIEVLKVLSGEGNRSETETLESLILEKQR